MKGLPSSRFDISKNYGINEEGLVNAENSPNVIGSGLQLSRYFASFICKSKFRM